MSTQAINGALSTEIERYSHDGHVFHMAPFVRGERLTGQYHPAHEKMCLVQPADQDNEVGRRIVERTLDIPGVAHVVAHQGGLTVLDQWWIRGWDEIKSDVLQILEEELRSELVISLEYNGPRYDPICPY